MSKENIRAFLVGVDEDMKNCFAFETGRQYLSALDRELLQYLLRHEKIRIDGLLYQEEVYKAVSIESLIYKGWARQDILDSFLKLEKLGWCKRCSNNNKKVNRVDSKVYKRKNKKYFLDDPKKLV